MNAILAIPLELRLLVIFLAGVLLGTQANRGIYRLAWFARPIGPWSLPHPDVPPRGRWDRLPLVGWWLLRRESPWHGRGYWIRPILIELGFGVALAVLYWYEVAQAGVANFDPGPWTLHVQFLTHCLLIWLMLVATFIDFDEQTIPDAITIPGTLLGLTIAALWPDSRAIVRVPAPEGRVHDFLHIGSGVALPAHRGWPEWLDGPAGLGIGILCLCGWSFAVMSYTWTMRRGLRKAIEYACASAARHPINLAIGVICLSGILATTGTWWWGGAHWESLLSALVGMVVGGGAVWAVRIVGSSALGQEAMGFGDVTLMAAIGAFTGWQATLIIFFLAPFSAVFIAITQFLLTRRHDIAFGPYLCASAVIWLTHSGALWDHYGWPIFSLGWWVPGLGAFGLVLMGILLMLLRMLRGEPIPDAGP